LRAGSLLVTIFGDAIAPRGAAATLGSLIRLAEPLGLPERLVRTSVARLAHDDWLVPRRNGRLSEYRLSATGERRFSDATRRIYGEVPTSWDGRWTLVLLPPGTGRAREELRDDLRWLGFGQLGPGLFAHPTRTADDTREQLRSMEGRSEGIVVLESTSGDLESDRRLARTGWDLAELELRYRRFVRAFAPALEAVEALEPRPETAFVLRTLLIHEYRRIHLRDPMLPAALLPDNWIGGTAYEATRRIYARVFDAAETYLGDTCATLDGPLPKPAPEVRRRFGGLASAATPAPPGQ
jgi:phenylacetic acid degradation operon negative regulatory protein